MNPEDNDEFDPNKTVPAIQSSTKERLLKALRGESIEKNNTRSIAHNEEKVTPHWGTAAFNDLKVLQIAVLDVPNLQLSFSFSEIEKIMIGRHGAAGAPLPDVDLGNLAIDATSVSRRHAVIQPDDQVIVIKDLASTNGTYVNGKRIQPNEPRILRNGDRVRLGNLWLQITFVSGTKNI
jgi:hypothetical protein